MIEPNFPQVGSALEHSRYIASKFVAVDVEVAQMGQVAEFRRYLTG